MTPQDILSRIIYREAGFVVVDKPFGLVSAGPPHQIHGEPAPRQSVESLLVAALQRQVWAVHQLDRMTSGLNLFALKPSFVAPLAERLKTPGAKRYLAIVHGHPRAPQTIDVALTMALDQASGKLNPAVAPASSHHDQPIRSALTHLVSSTANAGAPADFALIEVALETGRQHQVRLHLAHIGHPLVGESMHRRPPCTLHLRHALHAFRLTLPATASMQALDLVAPMARDLMDLAARLGVEWLS